MTVITFTGTSAGVTEEQARGMLNTFIGFVHPVELHHGRCVGADEAAHKIAEQLGWRVFLHPAKDVGEKTAIELKPLNGGALYSKEMPLKRNVTMVALAELLVAAPRTMEEELRSGTWATIRAARRRPIPIIYCWPNGTVTDHVVR